MHRQRFRTALLLLLCACLSGCGGKNRADRESYDEAYYLDLISDYLRALKDNDLDAAYYMTRDSYQRHLSTMGRSTRDEADKNLAMLKRLYAKDFAEARKDYLLRIQRVTLLDSVIHSRKGDPTKSDATFRYLLEFADPMSSPESAWAFARISDLGAAPRHKALASRIISVPVEDGRIIRIEPDPREDTYYSKLPDRLLYVEFEFDPSLRYRLEVGVTGNPDGFSVSLGNARFTQHTPGMKQENMGYYTRWSVSEARTPHPSLEFLSLCSSPLPLTGLVELRPMEGTPRHYAFDAAASTVGNIVNKRYFTPEWLERNVHTADSLPLYPEGSLRYEQLARSLQLEGRRFPDNPILGPAGTQTTWLFASADAEFVLFREDGTWLSSPDLSFTAARGGAGFSWAGKTDASGVPYLVMQRGSSKLHAFYQVKPGRFILDLFEVITDTDSDQKRMRKTIAVDTSILTPSFFTAERALPPSAPAGTTGLALEMLLIEQLEIRGYCDTMQVREDFVLHNINRTDQLLSGYLNWEPEDLVYPLRGRLDAGQALFRLDEPRVGTGNQTGRFIEIGLSPDHGMLQGESLKIDAQSGGLIRSIVGFER